MRDRGDYCIALAIRHLVFPIGADSLMLIQLAIIHLRNRRISINFRG